MPGRGIECFQVVVVRGGREETIIEWIPVDLADAIFMRVSSN